MGTPPSGLCEWCATTSASIRTRGRRCPRRRAARSRCPSRSARAEAGAGTDKPTTTVRRRRHCVRNRGGVRMEDVAPRGADRTPPPTTPGHPGSFCSQTCSSPPVVPNPCCTDATLAHATTAHAKSLRAHRREAATSSVCLDPSTGSPPRPYGIDFAFAALWVSTRGNRRQRGGQNAHDARTQKPNRLAEPHCGRTAGRGVHRPAESQHGTEPPELLGHAASGRVRHREVDGWWAYRSHGQPGGVKLR